MNETVSARLDKFIKHLDVNQNDFAKSIGVSSPLISQMLNKNSNFGIDTLQKIADTYPQLNIEWLLKGVNPMIIDARPVLNASSASVKIPVINEQRYNDYVSGSIDINSRAIFSMTLPSHEFFFPKTASFQVNSNNMIPTLYFNDYVITEQNPNWEGNLIEGDIYVIVSKNNVFFKRFKVYRHTELIFENDNLAYPEDAFYKNEIKEIWGVKSKLSFYLGKEKATTQTIDNLSSLLKSIQQAQQQNTQLPTNTNTDKITGYFSTLFFNLKQQRISIFYYGGLSLKIIQGLKERIKDNLSISFKRDIKNRKKIYSLSIEIFSALNNPSITASSFFSLVCNDKTFYISVGCILLPADADAIDKEFKLHQTLSKTELLRKVKDIMQSPSLKNNENVLLGLLTIALRSGNTSETYVEKLNEKESLLILKIESDLQ